MVKLSLPKLPQVSNRPTYQGLGFVPGRQEQQEALEASGQQQADTYDIILQVSTVITSALEGVYGLPLKTAAYGAQSVVDGSKLSESVGAEALKKLSDKRNPLFTKFDAASGLPSPVTQNYLSSRRWKKLGGSAFQAFGNLLSLAPPTAGVNIPGTIYHGQATTLTALHMARLGYIATQYREAGTVQDWCRLLEAVKATKLATRGGQLVGSVVPLASMPTAIAAAVIKAGVKLTFTGACFAAAAQIHWIAFNEQGHGAAPVTDAPPSLPPLDLPSSRLSGPWDGGSASSSRSGSLRTGAPAQAAARQPVLAPRQAAARQVTGPKAGPASTIFWEIFTKRGATRLLGAYDVAALVREPAGWMALGDKLMLI